MRATVTGMRVQVGQVVEVRHGLWSAKFRLELKVETDGATGVGHSPAEQVSFPAKDEGDAKEQAISLLAKVNERIKDMDLSEALLIFPTLIEECSSTEELEP